MDKKYFLLVVLFLAISLVAFSDAQAESTHSFKRYDITRGGALSNDGSPFSYYYRPALNADSNVWVVLLSGGGSCHTQEECEQRPEKFIGTSNRDIFPDEKEFDGILSTNPQNPFAEAHHVAAMYTSSDGWMGNHTVTWQGKEWHFKGANNLTQLMKSLIATHGMQDGDIVVLSGTSAGGYGVAFNHARITRMMKEDGIDVYGIVNGGAIVDYERQEDSMSFIEADFNGAIEVWCRQARRCDPCDGLYPFIDIRCPYQKWNKAMRKKLIILENRVDLTPANHLLQENLATGDSTAFLRGYGNYFVTEIEQLKDVSYYIPDVFKVNADNEFSLLHIWIHNEALFLPYVEKYSTNDVINQWFDGHRVTMIEE